MAVARGVGGGWRGGGCAEGGVRVRAGLVGRGGEGTLEDSLAAPLTVHIHKIEPENI